MTAYVPDLVQALQNKVVRLSIVLITNFRFYYFSVTGLY